MSRFGPYLVFLILIIVGILVFIKYYVGDIRPAVLPSFPSQSGVSEESSGFDESSTSAGLKFEPSKVNLPLVVEDGYEIGLVGQQNGARDLVVSSNGVILVSSPSSGSVVAFFAENGKISKKVLLSKLNSPHGIAINSGKLFVAEKNRLARYSFDESEIKATFEKELMELPTGGHEAHTLVFDKEGKLLVKIGSSCNVCNESDEKRATILRTDTEGNNPEILSKGVRNGAFMTLKKDTGEIWATENGRDFLGDDLPPDEVNLIKSGDFGWPFCYGDRVHDDQFDAKGSHDCASTIPSLYGLPAHTAPLGLAFMDDTHLLVSLHGSWNRSTPIGYKVVKLTLEDGKVVSMEDFLSGFLAGSVALGRPVDVEVDKDGYIYVSDDKSGNIYVISKRNI